MVYIFSEAGQAILKPFINRKTLFAFDLDGTLAPLAGHPREARIPENISRPLAQLNQEALVVVITGRGREDALSHLDFPPHFLIGNHGAEGLPGEEERENEYRHICSGWENQLLPILRSGDPGILYENKGTTLSIHYRAAKDPDDGLAFILNAIDHLSPRPRRVAGKFVENLVAADSPNKGHALLSLMKHIRCDRSIFVGDDVTDEDVFVLTEQSDSILGIRVGKDGITAARTFLREQQEMERLLGAFLLSLDMQ